jgi:hypothetical protein
MQNIIRRLIVWAGVIALILLIPLVLTIRDGGVEGVGWNWTLSDFIIMGTVLFGVGLAYELLARRSEQIAYRAAFSLGLLGAFLLFWVNGAVGIIGSEDNPANLLYGAVFAVGLVGSLIARFKPRGMAYTLFAAALVQMLVPTFALFVWPAQTSWGEAGVMGVFVLNGFFAFLFVVSGLLFRRAKTTDPVWNRRLK